MSGQPPPLRHSRASSAGLFWIAGGLLLLALLVFWLLIRPGQPEQRSETVSEPAPQVAASDSAGNAPAADAPSAAATDTPAADTPAVAATDTERSEPLASPADDSETDQQADARNNTGADQPSPKTGNQASEAKVPPPKAGTDSRQAPGDRRGTSGNSRPPGPPASPPGTAKRSQTAPAGTSPRQAAGSPGSASPGSASKSSSSKTSPGAAHQAARKHQQEARQAARLEDHGKAFLEARKAWEQVRQHPDDPACEKLAKELLQEMDSLARKTNSRVDTSDRTIKIIEE